MPTLLDLLQSLDEQPPESLIYAVKPWTAASAAAVAALDEPPAGLDYLLEVELVHDVLKVWSCWRGGAQPSSAERFEAVIHYAEYDAYLDVRH
ncbi:hypothetical protein ACIPRL_37070 [Streptomyces sp. NPDC090085]|uniref:hypothetical protein n=1 Tax=Streptomyces sp. NPDC090085 TaxID=3365943 RepID=UPI00380EDC6C